MKTCRFYILFFVCLLAYNSNGQSVTNKHFIDSSIKIANSLMDSVFGQALMKSSVLFDKSAIIIYGGTNNPFVMFKDYKNDFKPIKIEFSYDIILKKDTIALLVFELDSNFKVASGYTIKHTREAYEEDADVVSLMGWKNLLLGNFKYEYKNIVKIKNKTSKDTSYDVYLVYEHLPIQVIKGSSFFVGVRHYWLITTSTVTSNGDGSYTKRAFKSIKMDVNNGSVIDEIFYEDRKNQMNYR